MLKLTYLLSFFCYTRNQCEIGHGRLLRRLLGQGIGVFEMHLATTHGAFFMPDLSKIQGCESGGWLMGWMDNIDWQEMEYSASRLYEVHGYKISLANNFLVILAVFPIALNIAWLQGNLILARETCGHYKRNTLFMPGQNKRNLIFWLGRHRATKKFQKIKGERRIGNATLEIILV